MVASSFTASTLSEHGVPRDRVHVAPYGVDHNVFATRVRAPREEQPFTIIFVGSLVQRKGLSYLLDAIRLIRSQKIRVVLCGRGLIDRHLLEQYSDLNLEINTGSPRAELVRKIHEADVFVLPSLAEGFGHVILEIMSCGVPAITTPNTCAPDVMTDGVDGFIVPIRDAEAIAEKICWGIDNRRELAAMGVTAAEQARRFTWERFRAGAREAYREMLASTR
jgi:glycosyltransferase involved in cell wall biosynthesis